MALGIFFAKEKENIMDLQQKLMDYAQNGRYPFHMPGHKRNMDLLGDGFPYDMDITEIDGFDNLHHAQGILKQCMEKAATLWKSKASFLLINGSSGGLLAAIRSMTKRGDGVLMARNCHRAVYHGVELCGLCPRYLVVPILEDWQIHGSITPAQVAEALEDMQNCKLVIITSPTYEGVVSDIAGIADVVHKKGALLLVDEAHGAHFGFSTGFPDTAVHLGADIVVQSLHKTLPCPTQTAILHICSENVCVSEVKRQLSVFQTSSPSYVLLSAIDHCMTILQTQKEMLFSAYEKRLKRFYEEIKVLQILQVYQPQNDVFDFDKSKLILHTKKSTWSGVELSRRLRKIYQLEMEMQQPFYALAMTSVCDTDAGLERLQNALIALDKQAMISKEEKTPMIFLQLPEVYCSVEEALQTEQKEVPLWESAGYVCADYVWIYPPGVPFVVAGEWISQELVQRFTQLQKQQLEIECAYGTDGCIMVLDTKRKKH